MQITNEGSVLTLKRLSQYQHLLAQEIVVSSRKELIPGREFSEELLQGGAAMVLPWLVGCGERCGGPVQAEEGILGGIVGASDDNFMCVFFLGFDVEREREREREQ